MNNEEKILEMLGSLTSAVKEMQTDISDLKQGQAKLEQGQAKLEQGQAKLEKEVQTTKEIVTRIEYEHGKSLKALHDGYSMLYDISKEVIDDIKDLRKTQEEQDVRTKVLEYRRNNRS